MPEALEPIARPNKEQRTRALLAYQQARRTLDQARKAMHHHPTPTNLQAYQRAEQNLQQAAQALSDGATP